MKSILLASISAIITLIIALQIIKWLAPGLLGFPVDLQLVRVSKEVVPFYESVFSNKNSSARRGMLNDPYIVNRNAPFQIEAGNEGPTDILGFRNRQVPHVADIITIGDSQTFGNNALLEDNWPGWMMRHVESGYTHYSMATGGWGAIQYLNMFDYAQKFRPRVIIIALYTGNDSLDSFKLAYGQNFWEELIPDKSLSSGDAPKVDISLKPNELWTAVFKDGTKTVFTPNLRFVSNMDHPAVKAGYQIIKDVVTRTAEAAGKSGIKLVYTVVPTKEFVYQKKIIQENLQAPRDYIKLITSEARWIDKLRAHIENTPGVYYVNLIEPLQLAALSDKPMYPEDSNGHPVAYGYSVIGKHVAALVSSMLPELPRGAVSAQNESGKYVPFVISDGKAYLFDSDELLLGNGWGGHTFKLLKARDMATLPKVVVDQIDIAKYGPGSLLKK